MIVMVSELSREIRITTEKHMSFGSSSLALGKFAAVRPKYSSGSLPIHSIPLQSPAHPRRAPVPTSGSL